MAGGVGEAKVACSLSQGNQLVAVVGECWSESDRGAHQHILGCEYFLACRAGAGVVLVFWACADPLYVMCCGPGAGIVALRAARRLVADQGAEVLWHILVRTVGNFVG